jgi:hypothetical protein
MTRSLERRCEHAEQKTALHSFGLVLHTTLRRYNRLGSLLQGIQMSGGQVR